MLSPPSLPPSLPPSQLILRTFKPDPVVMGEFGRVEDIEPPVLYVGNNMVRKEGGREVKNGNWNWI